MNKLGADDFIVGNGATAETLRSLERVSPADMQRLVENGGSPHNSLTSLFSQPQKVNKPILSQEALYGLAGDIVRAVDPYTESDPIAVLINTLVGLGNIIGAGPHYRVEYTDHHMNLFIAQVGDTAKGRKGTGWSTPKYMFKKLDEDWASKRVTSGLSSGEGLIYAVRDARIEMEPVRQKGRPVEYEEIIKDHGVDDKRLLVVEEELAQALKVMSREGNILSTITRQAWDHLPLNPLTKNNPIRATGAHISIIGHITKAELLRHLTATDQLNGFANRFCWFWVERSKYISNPTGVPEYVLSPLISRLGAAVNFAGTVRLMRRNGEAEEVWTGVYPALSEGKPGMLGAVTSRAEAQVMRIACIYALLDHSQLVTVQHLKAALALWDYSEKSAMAIFGNLTGDPPVDKAKEALNERGRLTQTELSDLFGRHATAAELARVVRVLIDEGFATTESSNDGCGRPTTILTRAAKKAN